MKLIKLTQVKNFTGLGKTSIYKLMQNGEFPKPVSLIGKSIAWVDTEVFDWIKKKIDERDKGLNENDVTPDS